MKEDNNGIAVIIFIIFVFFVFMSGVFLLSSWYENTRVKPYCEQIGLDFTDREFFVFSILGRYECSNENETRIIRETEFIWKKCYRNVCIKHNKWRCQRWEMKCTYDIW